MPLSVIALLVSVSTSVPAMSILIVSSSELSSTCILVSPSASSKVVIATLLNVIHSTFVLFGGAALNVSVLPDIE